MSYKENQFYIGDSVQVMKDMLPDESIDLTVTSPPYDTLRDYNGFQFDFETMLSELYRVTKQGGVLVWVVGDQVVKGSETGTSFQQALYAITYNWNLHDTMIYEKAGVLPSKGRYIQCFEYMFIFSKGKPKTFNPIMDRKNIWGGTKTFGKASFRNQDGTLTKTTQKNVAEYGQRMNIWRYANGYGFGQKDKIAYNHPATFPEKLAEDHIISWSNPGDIVLDPMCGSGTVCKMAFLNNRKFIGIDISEEYINNICQPRLQQYGWNLGIDKI